MLCPLGLLPTSALCCCGVIALSMSTGVSSGPFLSPLFLRCYIMAPASTLVYPAFALVLAFLSSASAFVSTSSSTSALQVLSCHRRRGYMYPAAAVSRATTMASPVQMVSDSVAEVKSKVLQLAAAMDRGGMANPGKCQCQHANT